MPQRKITRERGMPRRRKRDFYRLFEPALVASSHALRAVPRPLCEALFAITRHAPTLLGVAIRYAIVRRLAKRCGRCVAVFEGVHLKGLRHIELGDHVSIHPMSYLDGSGGLRIGNDVSIAHASTVMTTEHDFTQPGVATRDAAVMRQSVVVGDDVWIASGVRVLAGVEIGRGCVIGAGAVVTRDVPPASVAAGVPARVLRATKKVSDSLAPEARRRITYVVTSSHSVGLLRGQLSRVLSAGFDVELVCSPGPGLESFAESEGVALRALAIRRAIHPLHDLRSLWSLYRHFRTRRPDLVNASTPKAGLLGVVAAWLAGVPVRIYVLRGLRLETTRGLKRRVLSLCEWCASRFATRTICVGYSLRDTYVAMKLADEGKAIVLGGGSSNGVDVDRFAAVGTKAWAEQRDEIRSSLGVGHDCLVYAAVGRINNDKGVADLVEAFGRLVAEHKDARLILIGGYDDEDALDSATRRAIEAHPSIVAVGHVDDPAPWLAAVDVLVHPSLREGFPNAILEAAAAGLPVVGRQVTGVVDAIQHGVTGLLIEPDGDGPLCVAMRHYAVTPSDRVTHGRAGREWVEQTFAREAVWSGLIECYDSCLDEAGRGTPPDPSRDGGMPSRVAA